MYAQAAPVPSGGRRQGKTGRVNASKPLMTPRNSSPRRWDVSAGSRLAAEKRQVLAGAGFSRQVDTTASG
jgi:hypothetical protein